MCGIMEDMSNKFMCFAVILFLIIFFLNALSPGSTTPVTTDSLYQGLVSPQGLV